MPGRRAQRVGKQVVHALASIVESEAHDPRLAGITFIDARATDDLRHVRVYYAVFGDAEAAAGAAAALSAASGFLRREVAQRLDLRHAPTLSFELDDAGRRIERIEKLLGESGGGQKT